jgi:hypothetical protein
VWDVIHGYALEEFIADVLCRIKETLRMKFADLANDFEQKLHDISSELSAMEGPLEVRCLLQ